MALAAHQNCWTMSSAALAERRKQETSTSTEMYLLVGLFMRWFGEVEHQIDRNTMHVLRMFDNFEPYGFMMYRTQFKSKIEMLRNVMKSEATDKTKPAIGLNLSARINFMDKNVNNLRTNFAHKLLKDDGSAIYFCHTGAVLDHEPLPQRPSGTKPSFITYDEATQVILWMQDFWHDLDTLADMTWDKPPLPTYEIDHPRSYLAQDRPRWCGNL
jgi:hypothetical protein